MSEYSLTPEAESDLEAIEDYLGQESLDVADRVLDELQSAMERLAQVPGLGHLRHDLADEQLRFWTVYSYLIIYRLQAKPL